MSEEHKAYASTAAATLEAHILSVHSAKSEAEWWAQREIERLRAENEKLRAAMTAFMDAYYKQMRLAGWSDLDVFYNDDYRAAAAALKETGK